MLLIDRFAKQPCEIRGLNVIALIMIFLWVPETKQRTLEELDYICELQIQNFYGFGADLWDTVAVPTRQHMRYQVMEVLPWAFKRYILRKDIELRPLYKFHHTY